MIYKKIIIAGINLIFFAGISQAADWVGFKEGVSSPAQPEIRVVKEDSSGITLEANVFGVNVEEKEVKNVKCKMGNEKFQLLSIPGHEWNFTQEVGKPKLPVIQVMLAIPDGVDIEFKIQNLKFKIQNSYLIYPVPKQVVKITPEGYKYVAEEFFIDEEFYEQDVWYPDDKIPNSKSQIPNKSKIQNLKSKICKLASIGYIRDQRVLRLEIFPIQFNPKNMQLRVYSNLKIEINYLRKKGMPLSLKQPEMASPFANVLKHTLLNYKPLTTRHLPLTTKRTGTVSYITNLKDPANSADYLIITSEGFYNNEDLRRLAEHRAEYNGFNVAVVNTTSIYNEFPITEKGTTTSIKDFIKYVYNNWSAPSMEDNHLGYVVIFGDGEKQYFSYVPPKFLREIYPYIGEPVADTWYVCINDESLSWEYWTMDIMIGRLPVESGTDTKVMVNKIIEYEKNPIPGKWRNKVLMVDGKGFGGDFDALINYYLLPVGFEVTKIEETGTGGMVVEAINDGHLLVTYNGHGHPLGWAMNTESPFSVRQVNSLYNSDKLPVVFGAACDTADFLWDDSKFPDCLAEAFLKKENGGAIAYWGASAGTTDGIIYPIKAYQFMAEYSYNSFSLGELTLNSYNYLWQHEWNMLGDPALTISRAGLEQNKPELEIEPIDINFNPNFPRPNEKTKISAIIHNLGDTDAADVLIKFFLGAPVNGVEIGSKTITTIYAKGRETTEINWIPDLPIGEYKIYVVIDPYDTIPEVETINNTAYKSIEVNIYQQGWTKIPQPLSFMIQVSPAVGDIDGDGDLEVVSAVTGNYLYIWHHNGDFVDNWPKLITVEENGDIAGTPILADMDNDNKLEIIISGRKRFYVLNHDGSNVPGFPKEGTNSNSPAIGDIDNDGDLEIVVEMNDKLYTWHHNGTLVDGDWPKEINLQGGYHPIIADIDKDGNHEIIAFSTEGKVYVLQSDGELAPGQWPKTIPYPDGFPDVFAVGNIDSDDELEIIIASYQSPKIFLYALNYDGSDVFGYPKQVGGNDYNVSYLVILGDIDNNGDMEVIIDTCNYLYVLNHDGSNVTGWPKAGSQRGPSHPLISDMDNDNQFEVIESIYYMKKGTITIWNNDGTQKLNLLMKPEDRRTSPLVIADIDLDGDVEVICAGEEFMHIAWAIPKVYIWDYEGKCEKGALEWPMANHDMRRTNCYNTDIVSPSRITDLKALNPKPTSIDLTWTAPGDDKDKGSSTCYFIRYATWTITPQNWHLTNKATSTIVPKDAGSPECFTVPNLCPTTTYYFCIRARDDDFNLSPLSNITFERTLSPAMITLISPTRGVVGKRVSISGCNFYPTETIRIEFGNTTTIALSTCVGGSFTTTFT
ncbi:MAG: C25 family cysteine peptidase, partial [bacterium]